MLNFLLGNLASSLPARYRTRIHTSRAAAFTSGLAQFLICLALFIYRYISFARREVFGGTTVALKSMQAGGETALSGSGIFVLLEYMIQPLTVVLAYFATEGVVRFVAAFVTGEVVPTLPLAAAAWLHQPISARRAEAAMGERVADLIESVDSPDIKLRIRSCRPKRAWDNRITVFYEDELYEVAEEQQGEAPRRFIYLLRHKPGNKLVRGTYHYDPEEVLTPTKQHPR